MLAILVVCSNMAQYVSNKQARLASEVKMYTEQTLLLDMLRIEVRVPVLLRASKAAHAGLHSLLCHHKPLHCQFSSACKGTTTEGFTHLEDPIHHLRLVQCS